MPRKVTKKLQRELKPDRRYQSVLVQRLINKSMLDGKKLTAERAVYTALETAAKKLDSEDPLAVFEKALKNVSPNFEVKSRRVGGATYQVPVEVRPERAQALAIRWLITAARNRSETTMAARLSAELLDAANNAGKARSLQRCESSGPIVPDQSIGYLRLSSSRVSDNHCL
jgi:small subunit ribosomal protein S7